MQRRNSHSLQNCIRFGPDVTKRFLGTNGLSLCIRSHEVPSSLRGFEDRHDSRLLTVFSASNYCGHTGNFGAVVIFHADMSYTVEEHMAPPLRVLVQEYAGQEAPAVVERSSQDMDQLRERMEFENMSKIEQCVVRHKDDLWWYWTQVDPTGTGLVPAAVWRNGMSSCLQLDLPWFSLQKSLVDVDSEGKVNYKQFLERLRPNVEENKAFEPGWEYKMVHKVYESLLYSDKPLQQIIAMFDSDGDGLVSPLEFKQAIQAANIGIPESQINAILRVIDRNKDGKLAVSAFLDRFQVVYSYGRKLKNEDVDKTKTVNVELLNKIGKELVGMRSRVDAFQSIDVNHDGYLTKDEFYSALETLAISLSEEEKLKIWSAVDVNEDGHLNYLEFCAAFQVVDTSEQSQKAMSSIIEAILSALQQNAMSMNFAFRYFDQENKGKVKVKDFLSGLRALNASMQGNAPLAEEQLEVLVEYVDRDKDGWIDYEEFLSAFDSSKLGQTEFVKSRVERLSSHGSDKS